MKSPEILHGVAAISGVLGLLALVGAWVAAANGVFLGLTEEHLFNDAKVLLLLSISAGIGTLIHMNLEKKK